MNPAPNQSSYQSSYAHNTTEPQPSHSTYIATAMQNSVHLCPDPEFLFFGTDGHVSMEDADGQKNIQIPNTTHRSLNDIRKKNSASGGRTWDNSSDESNSGRGAESGDIHADLRLKSAVLKKRKAPRAPQDGVSRFWTNEEHARFISALQACRGNTSKFRSIALLVRTRSETQCRTHYQKWVEKIIRDTKMTVNNRNREGLIWQNLAEEECRLLSEEEHLVKDKTSKTTVPPAWGVSLLATVLSEIEPKMQE